MQEDSETRRNGAYYLVSAEEKNRFVEQGFVHLKGVLSTTEVEEVASVYQRFLNRELEIRGRDYCDMSGNYEIPPEDFAVHNIMLPRKYYPQWQGNIYELRTASIAEQLCGPNMKIDYDQLLAKAPRRLDAVFRWHQDQAYWPQTTDPRTATCWLAIDDATPENGCMHFVPGSHLENDLRPHQTLHGDRDKSHLLFAEVDESEDVVQVVPIRSGDITVHCERVLHGSGGNHTEGWRRSYIVAYRSAATIQEERKQGFTHSHNDSLEVLRRVDGTLGEA